MSIRKLNDYRDISKFDETVQLSNNSDNIHIIAQDYAPATPAIGDLWIDTDAQSMPSLVSIVDLTNATTDYALAVGQTATITYTNATSVPLHVATDGGIYNVSVVGDAAVAYVSGNNAKLLPNNTQYTNAIVGIDSYSVNGSFSGSSITRSDFLIGGGLIYVAHLDITTDTKGKTCMAKVLGYAVNQYIWNEFMRWNDTTTAWTSLGTITFSFAQSGKIVIRRII